MARQEIQIIYDADIYYWITKTGRLVKLENGLPNRLCENEAAKFAERQVGPTFIFTSEEYRFNTTHLDEILRAYPYRE